MTKLELMLKYVSEHNDFYKKRIKEYGIKDPLDITQWPVLTRKELQENRYNMFSDGYKSKYFYEQLYRKSTSGSSGIPVNVYWDYNDIYASNLALWRKRIHYYNIHPYDKCVIFNLHSFNSDPNIQEVSYVISPKNILLINISLIHRDNKYKDLLGIIEEFKPDWLYIQPYVLDKLIKSYIRYGINPPNTIRYIESVGEILTKELADRAVTFFGVPLANMYGSEEMNCIAYECPFHNMHIMEDNILLECLHDGVITPFGEGESIITSLTNSAMPLIRYNQGDIIVVEELNGKCSCGSYAPIISMIKGRKLSSIIISDHFEINSFLLLEVIAEINNQYNDMILYYHYTYHKSKNELICTIEVNDNNWFLSVKESIKKAFASKVGKINLSFEVQQGINYNKLENKQKIVDIVD